MVPFRGFNLLSETSPQLGIITICAERAVTLKESLRHGSIRKKLRAFRNIRETMTRHGTREIVSQNVSTNTRQCHSRTVRKIRRHGF